MVSATDDARFPLAFQRELEPSGSQPFTLISSALESSPELSSILDDAHFSLPPLDQDWNSESNPINPGSEAPSDPPLFSYPYIIPKIKKVAPPIPGKKEAIEKKESS